MNLLVLFTHHSYSNAVTIRLNLKSYCDIDGNINLPDHKRIVCQIESLHRITIQTSPRIIREQEKFQALLQELSTPVKGEKAENDDDAEEDGDRSALQSLT